MTGGPAMVLEDVEIQGKLTVRRDTLVRRFRWRPSDAQPIGDYAFRTADGATVIAVDGMIDGQGATSSGPGRTTYGVAFSNFGLVGVHLQHFSDGVRVATRCALVGVRIDSGAREGTLHPDCIQTTGGTDVSIRWCDLDCRSSLDATLENGLDVGNAAFMVGNENIDRYPDSVVDRVHFGRNYANGGNYTVSVRGDEGVLGFEMVDCTFGPLHRYGPATVNTRVPARLERNVELVAQPLEVRRSS